MPFGPHAEYALIPRDGPGQVSDVNSDVRETGCAHGSIVMSRTEERLGRC